ncbi:response regulator transcription factor [Streptomyces sp. AC563]|uniref:response regulator n=1 Tax=Streptomyces buecherae TaxID=2763006 RepID=UPI00164EAD6B|nr:response regulator transcription factor [Streptomyces buecherae]MBC3982773.1 response regulator transcription factor [Streptomyces buecherae]MBC3988710.1 response regulator transcription factor [Streptomyces buecherae]QNJ41498.1 response regulator transcription factor [Streptomyces buecherae]
MTDTADGADPHGDPGAAAAAGRGIRVLVADDHTVMRAGVVALLAPEPGVEIVGEAANGAEAVAAVRALAPDVALLDLRMPVMDGVSATERIVASGASTRVLILTTYDTDAEIERAVEAGAVGYLLKDTSREQLVAAIAAAARGETVLAPKVAERLVARMRRPAPVALTGRELEVLTAVADGLSNAEIGRRLVIGEATVKTHLLRVFAKLDVSDRTHAVVVALDRGLLVRPDARGGPTAP